MDEADGVAELLNLVHAVGGKEDRFARVFQFDERVLQQDGVDGVEAGERLVHDDELGIVQQRRDELDLLLHALGELFGFLVGGFEDLQALAPVVCALRPAAALSRPRSSPMKTS